MVIWYADSNKSFKVSVLLPISNTTGRLPDLRKWGLLLGIDTTPPNIDGGDKRYRFNQVTTQKPQLQKNIRAHPWDSKIKCMYN